MSLSIKTDGQPEQRGLTCSQMEALYFLFYRSDQYHYHFHFAYRDTTGEKERFCGYAGTLYTGDESDESFDGDFPEGVDIYVTPNGFSNAYHRQGKYLRGLQNIVVDIDAHGAALSPDALHDHIGKLSLTLRKCAVAPVPLAVADLDLSILAPLLHIVLVNVGLKVLVCVFFYSQVLPVLASQAVYQNHVIFNQFRGHIFGNSSDSINVQGMFGS